MKSDDEVFVKIIEVRYALNTSDLLRQQAQDMIQEIVNVVFQRYGDDIWRFCRANLRNFPNEDVEDVCQEVFKGALESFQKQTYDIQQGAEGIKSWLLGIASNKCNDHLRNAGRSQETGVSYPGLNRGLNQRVIEHREYLLPLSTEFKNIVKAFSASIVGSATYTLVTSTMVEGCQITFLKSKFNFL